LGNTANNNTYFGIYIWGSNNNTITKNTINYNNITGIVVDTSNGNNIYLNCFNNILNAVDNGSNNHWDNGINGNYWADYADLDIDGNGIGDVPYNITGSAGSRDYFPLMKCPNPTIQVSEGVPGYNLFFLFGILSVIVIILSKKLKKS
jgi:parallel beta-helix repeat protein